jgi:hypothetical protein
MLLSISEILKEAGKLPKAKKIDFLRKHDSLSLRQVLRVIYDPKIEWLLPDTPPPWKKNGYTGVEGMFYKETRRLKIFIKGGGYDNVDRVKRENLFISLLQDIDDNDAELLAGALSKKPLGGLTEAVLLEAFPGLYETRLV